MAAKRRDAGDGSVYKQTTKDPKTDEEVVRWRGALVVGWTAHDPPRPRRKYVSGRTQAEVKQKLRKLRSDMEQNRLATDPGDTVAGWLDYWLEQVARPKVRNSSYEAYRTAVRHWAIPYLGKRLKLERLTPEHLDGLFKLMVESDRVASTPGVKRVLTTALKVAVARGKLARNPAEAVSLPPREEAEIEPLTRQQAQAVLAAAAALPRNEARWSVALALGLRQGEALGLTWPDIDLEAGTLRVSYQLQRITGKGLMLTPVKSRAGRRTISLPATLLASLRAHRARQNAERLREGPRWVGWETAVPYPGGPVRQVELVFPGKRGRPVSHEQDWRTWKGLLVAAGFAAPGAVPVGRSHHSGYVSGKGLPRLHDARHTAATLLLLQGVDVRVTMALFGWTKPEMAGRYQHILGEMRDAAAEQMESALWGPGSSGGSTGGGPGRSQAN